MEPRTVENEMERQTRGQMHSDGNRGVERHASPNSVALPNKGSFREVPEIAHAGPYCAIE